MLPSEFLTVCVVDCERTPVSQVHTRPYLHPPGLGLPGFEFDVNGIAQQACTVSVIFHPVLCVLHPCGSVVRGHTCCTTVQRIPSAIDDTSLPMLLTPECDYEMNPLYLYQLWGCPSSCPAYSATSRTGGDFAPKYNISQISVSVSILIMVLS